MSSSTPERRTETGSPDRSATEPDGAQRFRPHGSVGPPASSTAATPVGRERETGPVARPGPTTSSAAGSSGSTAKWEDPEESGPERVRHVVDRFDGAAGLLVLRLVTAVILAIRGLQKLQHLDVTRAQFAQIGVPSPDTLAVVVGGAEFAIAFALIIGAFIRLAGLGIAIITVGALVYVKWHTGDIFTAGQPGFNGEIELLLAGVGLALLGLGGGGWGVDRRFRRR